MSFSFRQTIPTTKASKTDNLFAGKSLLRAEEKKKEQSQAKGNSALQDYLAKKYASGDGGGSDGAAPKKKRKKKAADTGAIRIVDQDVSGFNAVDPSARGALPRRGGQGLDDDEEEEDDQPVIANAEEAAALMQQVEKAKLAVGWTAVDHDSGRGAGGRAARHDSPDASPPRRGGRSDSPDASPPRRGARHDSLDAPPPRRGRPPSPDASPPRRKARHDSPDASPPRRGRPASPDASPPRRGRHDSPDASPPRRQGRQDSPDASPPRRGRQPNPDPSPPRRKARHDSPDASPPRRRARHDSPDASPPRRGGGGRAAPDASPLRRGGRHDSPDASPPRRRARHDSPDAEAPQQRGKQADASPPRRTGRHDSPDASPPRRSNRAEGPAGAGSKSSGGMGPPRPPGAAGGGGGGVRMSDGTAVGLVKAEQLAEEMRQWKEQAEERRRNAEGRGAQTVYRDKATGKVMTADEALKAKEDERAKKKKPSIYDEDQTLEWRGGLAQKREAEERRRQMQEEAAKPFARADIEGSHDSALRDRVRFGDPFAHLARKRQPGAEAAAAAALTERYDQDKLAKSGFKVPQEVPPHSWLKRGVAAPANRYNIRPGRHWDGVNRSNGFEAELFKHQNVRAAKELEARLWSMGDM